MYVEISCFECPSFMPTLKNNCTYEKRVEWKMLDYGFERDLFVIG